MLQDIAALVVALGGILATVLGWLATRRGKREQRRLDTVADQALRAKTRLEETQQALDATRARAEAAEAGGRELSEQEGRCNRVVAELTDRAQTLLAIVVDEMSRAALGQQVAAIRPHPHEPLPVLGVVDEDDRPDPPAV